MRHRLLVGIVLTFLLRGAALGAADDMIGTGPLGVRGWRGDWTGRYPDANPVTAWDIEKGINVLWRVPTSRFGNAMPLVVGDRLYFTVDSNNLVCLDKMTGKVLWTSLGSKAEDYARLFTVDPKEAPWSKRGLNYGQNAGNCIPTPVTDGKRIWCKFSGTVFCYDLSDGKHLWSAPLHVAGGDHPHNVASLLLVGKVLICQGGSTDYWRKNSKNKISPGVLPKNPQTGKFAQWMVGLDADTGRILWDVGPLNAGGYGMGATHVPVIIQDGKQQRVFVLTAEGQLVNPEDGKLLMPYVGARSGCATPIPLGNRVLFPGALVELSMRSPTEVVAKTLCGAPGPANNGGVAYHNGMVYCGYRTSDGATRLLDVHELVTGRPLYTGVQVGPTVPESGDWPAPAVAGKYLFFPSTHSVAVADISHGRPWPLAMNRVERMHTGPVFDGERMYLRTYDAIACIARKGEEGTRYEREVNARTVIRAFPPKIGGQVLIEPEAVTNVSEWLGGPAFMYVPNKAPDQWIFAGSFPKVEGKDALETLGGCAKARPAAGMQVTFEGTSRTFAAVNAKYIRPQGLDTDSLTRKDREGQNFFFTWLIVGKPGYVTWNPRRPGVRLWLSGQQVRQGQVVRLDKGAYPALMRVAVTEESVQDQDMIVETAFTPADGPAVKRQKDLALVRKGRDYLKLVIDALPGTDEANQAESLLKAIE